MDSREEAVKLLKWFAENKPIVSDAKTYDDFIDAVDYAAYMLSPALVGTYHECIAGQWTECDCCGNCGAKIRKENDYCHKCGRKVDWGMTDKERIVTVMKEQIALCGPDDEHDRITIYLTVDDAKRIVNWLDDAKPSWRQGRPSCGGCGLPLHNSANYCEFCGKQVKWDDR